MVELSQSWTQFQYVFIQSKTLTHQEKAKGLEYGTLKKYIYWKGLGGGGINQIEWEFYCKRDGQGGFRDGIESKNRAFWNLG